MPSADSVPARWFYSVDWMSGLPPGAGEHRINVARGTLPNLERQGGRSLRKLSHVDAPAYVAFREQRSPAFAYWMDFALELPELTREDALAGRVGPQDLVWRTYETLGRAALFDGARVAPDRQVLDAFERGVRAAFVAAEHADRVPVTAGGLPLRTLGPSAFVRVRPSTDPGHVAYDVETPRATLLVASEKWFPGWVAELDGKEVPIARVNLTLRGVRVPPGSHRVEMRYRPPSFRTGLAVTLLGLIGVAAGFVFDRSRRQATAAADTAAAATATAPSAGESAA
jgi:hypothetical protein